MGNVLNRRNVLLIIIAIVVLPIMWWSSAGIRGQLMARYDAARGHYRVLFYGYPALGFSEYRTLLHDRYGVELEAKGCVMPSLGASYANAYNRESVAVINRKFGHDVFKECWGDAIKKRVENLKAEQQKVSHSE